MAQTENAATQQDDRSERLNQRDHYWEDAKKLRAEGKLAEAIAAAEKVLAIERELFGDTDEEFTGTLELLSVMYGEQGNFPSARKAARKLLDLEIKLHGKTHWHVTDARLGVQYVDLLAGLSEDDRGRLVLAEDLSRKMERLYGEDEYDEASRAAREALAIRRKVLGDEHPDTANSLDGLGVMLGWLGEYEEAQRHLEEAVAIYRKALGDKHPQTAICLHNLGLVLDAMGQHAEASRHLREALAIRRKVLPDKHPDTADCLHSLGCVLRAMSQYEEARRRLEEALTILGNEGPQAAQIRYDLASVLAFVGENAGARRHLEEGVAIVRKVFGEHPKTADYLCQAGVLLNAMHERAEARQYLEEALRIQRKVLGDEHPDTASTLHELGWVLHLMGEHKDARSHLNEALAIRRKVLPDGHPDTASTLYHFGVVLEAIGEHEKARQRLEEALPIYRKVFGDESSETAECLSWLGTALDSLGEYEKARRRHEEARRIRGKLDEQESLTALMAYSMRNHGLFLHLTGEYAEARRYLEEALDAQRILKGDEHPETASTLNELGSVLHSMGEYGEARRRLEEALAIRRKVLPEGHPDTVISLNDLGKTLHSMGEYVEARRRLEEALEITQNVSEARDSAALPILNNLGLLLASMGKYKEARKRLEQAVAISRKAFKNEPRETAASLHNLGQVMCTMGEYAEARRFHEEALAICRKALGEEQRDTATNWQSLGFVLHLMGEYAQAKRHYEQALAVRKKVWDKDHPETAESLISLGVLLGEMGDRQEAWRRLTTGGSIYAQTTASVLSMCTQREHAVILGQKRYAFDLLLNLAPDGAALDPQRGSDLLSAVLRWKATGGQTLLAQREARVLVGSEVESPPTGGHKPTAGTLAGVISEAQRSEPQRLEEELKLVRRRLVRRMLRGLGHESPEKRRQYLEEDRQKCELLERRLADLVPTYAVLQRAEEAGPEQVAGRLGPRTALVELIRYNGFDFRAKGCRDRWGAPQYAAVLVWRPDADGPEPAGSSAEDGDELSAKPVIRFVPLREAKPIDDAIGQWRRAVSRASRSIEIDPETEERLYEEVWERIARELPNGIQAVRIAPDGQLALVPFEAIRLPDGRYLVEQLAISYVSSGRDLMPRPDPPGGLGPALVMGDPHFEATGEVPGLSRPLSDESSSNKHRSGEFADRGIVFERRDGFLSEVEAVVKALRRARPNGKVYQRVGREADEWALSEVSRPWVLSLITHGFFLEEADLRWLPTPRMNGAVALSPGWARTPMPVEDPRLRCGLALAGANRWRQRSDGGQSDGLLTALEVENLDLWGTELVVLSACETGLGEVQVGEGVLGLRRAFQLAGAKTVLASLWNVPDIETKRLMTRFFELWSSGAPKAEALRKAQLELIAEMRGSSDQFRRLAPPWFWAGFICHGEAN